MMYNLYRTTNLKTGKIYVGVHLENGRDYLGSGQALTAAIAKYGKHNFTREIIALFETSDAAFEAEAEMVNEDFVARPDNYNMIVGGTPGFRADMDRTANNEAIWASRTQEERDSILDSAHRGNMKAVEYEGKRYGSIKELAIALGISHVACRARKHRGTLKVKEL